MFDSFIKDLILPYRVIFLLRSLLELKVGTYTLQKELGYFNHSFSHLNSKYDMVIPVIVSPCMSSGN